MSKFKIGDPVRVAEGATCKNGDGDTLRSRVGGCSGLVTVIAIDGDLYVKAPRGAEGHASPEFCTLIEDKTPTRSAILADADELVNGDRQDDYGSPAESLGRIAALWSTYLAWRPDRVAPLEPAEVALLMDLAKTARLAQSLDHRDSWVDKSGYAAIGGEVAAK